MGAGCDPGAARSHTHGPRLAGSHRGSERQGGHGETVEVLPSHHLSILGSGTKRGGWERKTYAPGEETSEGERKA